MAVPPLSLIATKDDCHLIPHYVRNDKALFGPTDCMLLALRMLDTFTVNDRGRML
jgi:hypothetical protein